MSMIKSWKKVFLQVNWYNKRFKEVLWVFLTLILATVVQIITEK